MYKLSFRSHFALDRFFVQRMFPSSPIIHSFNNKEAVLRQAEMLIRGENLLTEKEIAENCFMFERGEVFCICTVERVG